MSATTAYKILTAHQWAEWQANGVFIGAPVDLADGYIHMSTAEQVTETADKHFAGQDNLFVVTINLVALGDSLRWEPSRGGALFPHAYAPLPLETAIAAIPLTRENTHVMLPEPGRWQPQRG
jgi:uncharacterized protein (DUF952 family)